MISAINTRLSNGQAKPLRMSQPEFHKFNMFQDLVTKACFAQAELFIGALAGRN